ncbi:uncharacterized protein LODBEIA_P60930 [Lodderomyces beijingensis]|uniref:GRIP domain-containing protein n=1 Tax=Lodderomyces beijingensis TaxID=1775926 RepID=A0ABP0ZV60_9ASCO
MHIEPSQCTSRDVLNYISSLKGLASKLKRQVTELDGANKTLKSELAKAENEVSILRESSKEERDAVTKLAAWRNDWKTFENEMNQELALKEAEVNKWKNKVLEKSEKENQLAKSVERLEKDLSSKNEEIKKLKDDSLKKTQMENQMETRIESLEKDLLSKDEVSQKVQKELLEKMQHDKMEHEALKRKEIDILHSELAQENSRADQMAQSIQSLEEKLSLKDAHVIKLKNKLSETTTREDQMAMEMKRLQNELAITKRNNETKNRDLLHRNHLLKKETVDCKRREKEIVSTMKHLEQDVQLTRSEIEAKSDALERVKSQEEAIYGELEMMKNEFACFRKQFADEMAINKPPRHAPGQITSAVSQAFATLVEETERNVNSSGSKSFNGADTVNLCSLYENNYFEALNESRDNRNSRIFSQELSKNLLKLTCGYCEKLIPREEKQIAYLKSLVKDLSQKKFEPSDDDINYLSRQVVKTVAYLFSKSLKTALVVEKKNLKMPLEAI